MEITSIYASNLQKKPNNQFVPESSSNKSFDDYMNKVEEKKIQPQKIEKDNRKLNKTDIRLKKENELKSKSSEPQKEDNENTELTNNISDDKATQDAPNNVENEKTNDKAAIEKEETNIENEITNIENDVVINSVNNQIITNLADKLDITINELEGIMDKLNIQPSDLLDNEVLSSFVREMFNVESNVELLNIPNVNETYKMINDALTESVKIAEKLESTYGLETEKTLSIDEAIISGDEVVVETPQMVNNSAESKNTNQNTGFNMDSSDKNVDSYQSNDGEVVVEISEDNTVITQNNSSQSQTTRVQTKITGERQLNQTEVVKQIVEQVKSDVKGNVSEVKMLLRPESLGELSLKISAENGIITAQFIAENQRVKEIIESNFNELKDALSESGVNVGQLSVSVSSDNENEAMNAFERERQKSARRINKILSDANFAVNMPLEEKFVSEEEVLDTQINYTV